MIQGRHVLVIAGVTVVGAAAYLALAAGPRTPSSDPRPRAGSADVRAPRDRAAVPPAPRLPTADSAEPRPAPEPPMITEPQVTVVNDPASAATPEEQRAVTDWIAQHRNEWITACGPPAQRTTFRLRAVVNADGTLRAHAITGDAAEVARCLSALPFTAPLPARGTRVDLGLGFELP